MFARELFINKAADPFFVEFGLPLHFSLSKDLCLGLIEKRIQMDGCIDVCEVTLVQGFLLSTAL